MNGTHEFLVYGSFKEPNTGFNFIVVRVPNGRTPWSKKIVPAIDRLVRQWYEEPIDRSPGGAYRNRERRYWNVDGLEEGKNTVWDSGKYRRYVWTYENGLNEYQP